jgi:hypothetical protein
MGSSSKQSIVLRVGDGRGFVVAPKWSRFRQRYVITAAHCLPKFPPRASISHADERTYPKLLGPIGKRCSVWAECLFVDPVADIALLDSPDSQELSDEAAYDQLIETVTPLEVSDIAGVTATAELLSLAGHKFACVVQAVGRGPLWTKETTQGIEPGMSGSPILAEDGAIGVVTSNRGPHARLASHLPGWLLGELGVSLSRGYRFSPEERRVRRRLGLIKVGDIAGLEE